MKVFIFLSSLLFSVSLLAQIQAEEMVSMHLHLNVKSPSPEKSFVKNLRDQQALNFDVPTFIAEHEGDVLRIFGSKKNVKDIVNYQFESQKLERQSDCDSQKYCEKIVSIERLPYLGLAVEPMSDFSGVLIDRIVKETPAEDSALEIGDVITSIEGFEISTACDLTGAVNDQDVEDYVSVEYTRDGVTKKTYIPVGYRIKKNITWIKCCDQDLEVPEQIFEDLALAVFPNPTSGITQFSYQSTMLTEAQLVLTDMAGHQVLRKKVFPIAGHLNDYLDLSRIASGVYILNITQGGKTVSEKIVLQRK